MPGSSKLTVFLTSRSPSVRGVEVDIAARRAGDGGDVVDAVALHDPVLQTGERHRPGHVRQMGPPRRGAMGLILACVQTEPVAVSQMDRASDAEASSSGTPTTRSRRSDHDRQPSCALWRSCPARGAGRHVHRPRLPEAGRVHACRASPASSAASACPTVLAWPIILAELLGGLAILVGFHARLVSLALLPVLLGALVIHAPNGWVFNAPNGGWEYPAFLALAALAQVLIGDGAYAAAPDHLPGHRRLGTARRRGRPEAAARWLIRSRALAWDDLRLVKAIADAQGLAGAAERLGVNHSTVFRRLGQIEDALGVMLFERHRTGYAPTVAGEEMVARRRRASTRNRRLRPQARRPRADARRRAARDHQRHAADPPADADVRCVSASSARTCGSTWSLGNQSLNLSQRDADVAIRATDGPPETLVGRRAPGSPGRSTAMRGLRIRSPRRSLQQLYERPWVAPRRRSRQRSERGAAHLREHVRRRADRLPRQHRAGPGRGGRGRASASAICPASSPTPRPGLVRLAAPAPELAADLWLLTHPDLRHSPRVRVFLDFMAAEIARHRRLIEGELGHPARR